MNTLFGLSRRCPPTLGLRKYFLHGSPAGSAHAAIQSADACMWRRVARPRDASVNCRCIHFGTSNRSLSVQSNISAGTVVARLSPIKSRIRLDLPRTRLIHPQRAFVGNTLVPPRHIRTYATPATMSADEHRLPTDLKPLHYDLTIKTDLQELNFSGQVKVECVNSLP